jgi:DNA-binding MarR family transcriptional regulator
VARGSGSLVSVSPTFLDGYLPYQLQRADNLLSRRFQRSLRERGVETSEWRVLAVLLERRSLLVNELAERCLLPQPTTTHAVSRLETSGLVTRTTSEHDGRRRIVALTSAGTQLAEELIAAAQADLAVTLDEAGVQISADFADRLSALRGALET